MAKKSRKRPARPKKDNAGCMSGLISMFDFRQGRFTQKLLPDRKHGSGRHAGTVHSRNKFGVLSNLEEKHEDVSDATGKEVRRDNSSKASIKALMAEEMSKGRTSKKIPSSKVEQLRAEMSYGDDLEKTFKKRPNHNYKVESNHDINDLRATRSTKSDTSESSSFGVNLAELMVEFCRENHECQEKHIERIDNRKNNCIIESDAELTQKHYFLQTVLRDITEALLTQNSVDSKEITSHGAVQQKEFMDALETLNSNKDTFSNLLQDPNSLLFRHILDLQNTQTREILHVNKSEESVSGQVSHKQNRHHFFRKKDKSDGAKPLNENSSQALKRIVVLKPGPARFEHYSSAISPISSEGSERGSSHFSLKDIKRRLRNVIGESKKERDLIAMDGILHKIPYGSTNSDENNKTLSSTQQISKLAAFLKRGDTNAKQKQQWPQKKVNDNSTLDHPLYRESVFYEEARNRLAEMLSSGGQNGVSSPKQVSKSLGRILSLPGYNSSSPRFSPGRDKEVDSPRLMRSSLLQKIKQDDSTSNFSSSQSIESLSCSDNNLDNGPQAINSSQSLSESQFHTEEDNLDNGPQAINSSQSLPESQFHTDEDVIQKGTSKTEECESLDIPVEFITDELVCSSERCNEDSGPCEEALPSSPSVSVSLISNPIQKLEAPESTAENLDRPSPVSVLEPFFEDINSPERSETDNAELTPEPRQLSFEECGDSQLILTSTILEANPRTCMEDTEAKLKYVRTVLEASGLIYNKLPERWQLSDQLLDQFVFDEVEIIYGHLIDDSKLLFDCINKVLVEIRDKYLICTPWMSFIAPSIRPTPTGESFMHEVCKGVDRHLQPVYPYTLDGVVRKDLEVGTWMNVQLETEGAVFEIEEVILDYIMEETILELWE